MKREKPSGRVPFEHQSFCALYLCYSMPDCFLVFCRRFGGTFVRGSTAGGAAGGETDETAYVRHLARARLAYFYRRGTPKKVANWMDTLSHSSAVNGPHLSNHGRAPLFGICHAGAEELGASLVQAGALGCAS